VQKRFHAEPDTERLPEPAATQLLTRASELDAARAAVFSVADLRAAASEAGISACAFDAALAELQGTGQAHVPDVRGQPRRRSRLWAFAAAGVALIAAGALAVSHRAPAGEAAVPGAPMVDEAIVLRCLSPGEAAELIRPLLRLRSNTVVYAPAHAPRVLTVRGTPAQLRHVKAVLEKYEGASSPACAPR
jgi:hypothetical protein